MIAFAILAAVVIFLATASLFPDGASWYTSWPAVALWSAASVAAIVVMVRARLWRRPAVFALHVALLVILAGALVTHICGTSERLHLEVGQTVGIGGETVALTDFTVEYYPGTSAPSDFVATVAAGDSAPVRISMNHVGSIGGARIFLTSCDADRGGCTFTVTADRYGTAVTYAGYALLLISMLLCSLPKHFGRRAAVAAAALCLAGTASAAETAPPTVHRAVADELADIYVYHSDRVAPFSTLAREFTLKLYGGTSYKGLTPEQVLAGWLFYYDAWKTDPGIKIKDAATRAELGGGKRFALTQFFTPSGYRFDDADHPEANEKFSLASSAATGSLWQIYPYSADSTGAVQWYSPVSELPPDMPLDDWRMTRHSLGYLAELVAMENWMEAAETVRRIGRYQLLRAPQGSLPSPARVKTERAFIALGGSIWPAALMLMAGLVLLIWPRRIPAVILLVAAAVWVASLMGLNWYASGHLPMANGYETMQWMALFALLLSLFAGRRWPQVLPLGLIVAALALAVAFMGQRNPQLTNLMPVLRSPLLSVHVLAVMLAYALLAIMALASAMWLCGRRALLPMARKMLRPAVFLLAAGIFIGAVWANMSWGRYWGWDPKEVWALITMIVYSFALHRNTLPAFRSDRVFAWWTLASFATVLMTYVGVNFVLGGLHSYA